MNLVHKKNDESDHNKGRDDTLPKSYCTRFIVDFISLLTKTKIHIRMKRSESDNLAENMTILGIVVFFIFPSRTTLRIFHAFCF